MINFKWKSIISVLMSLYIPTRELYVSLSFANLHRMKEYCLSDYSTRIDFEIYSPVYLVKIYHNYFKDYNYTSVFSE